MLLFFVVVVLLWIVIYVVAFVFYLFNIDRAIIQDAIIRDRNKRGRRSRKRSSRQTNALKARSTRLSGIESAECMSGPSIDQPSTSGKRPASRSPKPDHSRKEVKQSVTETFPGASTGQSELLSSSEDTDEDFMYRLPTASERKLDMFEDVLPLKSSNSGEPMYLLCQRKAFLSIFQHLKCEECGMELCAKLSDNQGFCYLIRIECENCNKVWHQSYTSARVLCEDSTRPPFQVNRQMAEAFTSFGLGHAALETFSETMGMNCMSGRTFQQHLHALSEDLQKFKAEVLDSSRKLIREAYELEDGTLKSQDIIDIDVSYDGSWQKKGHTSLYGVGFVIDSKTGLVVDYESFSKYCHACVLAEKSFGNESEEFLKWQEEHSGHCNKNYEGSSHAMEMGIAAVLWKRSIANCKMRYKTILSDGDAKTWKHLIEQDPYGELKIEKEECINHVSKRLSSALKNLISECKAKKITLGGTSAGALTERVIVKLAGYYRKAIKENGDDVQAMKTAIMAAPFHCSSTDESPQHQHCPTGKQSWCFYNRAQAEKRQPRSHAEMSLKINQRVFTHIQPLYERLTDESLLQRCTSGGTQNANEAIHSVLWSKCPKEKFVSKRRLDMALLYATSHFNMGKYATLILTKAQQREEVPAVSARLAQKRDKTRIYKSVESLKSSKYKKREERKKEI